jgi:hypothetical protein
MGKGGAGVLRRRSRSHGRLAFDRLEERCVPAAFDSHGLTFEAAGPFQTNGSTTTASGTIEVGLTPPVNSSFTPLISLSAGVTLNDKADPSFSYSGSVDAIVSGTDVPLFQGSETVSVDQLLKKGLSEAHGDSVTVAGATFTLDSIVFQNARQGPLVALQGSVMLPGIDGLTIAVNGSNYVDISAAGVSLTGIDGTLNGTVQVGGLSFDAENLTVAYAHTNQSDTFTVTGESSFTLETQTVAVEFGGGSTQGLVIQNGVLQVLDMSVTGTFTLLGLTIGANDLTFDYQAAQDAYNMYGTLTLSSAPQTFNRGSGQVFQNVSASLGTQQAPGLVYQESLQTLDITVSGMFNLLGLSMTANSLTVDYSAAMSTLELTGGITVSLASSITV